ncbi:MAG: DUF2292 domain-containing protein [Alphaproteobacteria bacterium]|jgi:hypothetical protein|nr:DUF2292 domain-containing protein [Alphaproteobacteria bacterium]
MGVLQFLAAVVQALAWPALALFFFLFVAKRSSHLIRFVKSIRYGDIEITLQDARKEVELLKLERGVTLVSELETDDKILRLAEIDPSVAIVEVWKKLEAKVIQLIQYNGLIRFTRPDLFVQRLYKLGKISTNELELFQRLHNIRNESVHARPSSAPTIAQVIEYRDFVEAFIARLEQIRNEPGHIDLPPKE